MPSLQRSILSVFHDCLKLRQNEKLFILSDLFHEKIAKQFWDIAGQLKTKNHLCVIPENAYSCASSFSRYSPILSYMDAVILLCENKSVYTPAIDKLLKNGTRIINMNGMTIEGLIRNFDGSYDKMICLAKKLADILTIGKSVELKTSAGTDLKLGIHRMKGFSETGIAHDSGTFSFLPAGMASIAPAAESVYGTIIVDEYFSNAGTIKNRVKMTVKEGKIVRISGGAAAEKIRKLLKSNYKNNRNIAELGIGTNNNAIICDNCLEASRKHGTAHISLGNNNRFGGNRYSFFNHKVVMTEPTITIDGKTIVSNGKMTI